MAVTKPELKSYGRAVYDVMYSHSSSLSLVVSQHLCVDDVSGEVSGLEGRRAMLLVGPLHTTSLSCSPVSPATA